ncbi:MAG TPA: imidazole glycerol phosphate synthase subunit HisH, partial [Phycisphaerae bacterium]|nr:imidazole glycerol phosphate synthase subunit HisH [Phycisphaerae bacterium]
PRELDDCGRILLPGVGHFAAAAGQLKASGMSAALQAVARKGKPVLGVCLGAQLMLEASDEAPDAVGLGLIPGRVVRLKTKTIPHMGWNRVKPAASARLFDAAATPPYFYFAHSFVCAPVEKSHVAAETTCDAETFCVAVQRDNIFGVQFHPEKSAGAGLDVLRRFATC